MGIKSTLLVVWVAFVISCITLPAFDDLSYFIHKIGSHEAQQTQVVMEGVLKMARKLNRDIYGSDLGMFPENKKVYYIEIAKYNKDGTELRWGFHASCAESPQQHLNQLVRLQYNYIHNWLGNSVEIWCGHSPPSPFRTYIGLPVYAKIYPL
jgi:hypothetical protein